MIVVTKISFLKRAANSLLSNFIPPIVMLLLNKLKFQPSSPGFVKHSFGTVSILFPRDHQLPVYQANHRNYDRFLPHLASYLGPSQTIVDIGANVGDSLAAMVGNHSRASFICVEADDDFYGQLLLNIEAIKREKPLIEVHAIKCLVGKHVSQVSLDGTGGTKHAVVGAGGLSPETLDDILERFPDLPEIRLLKSDVDGFDFDVIDSAFETIKRHNPILFFECYFEFENQLRGYVKTLTELGKMGYSVFAVFDNFGSLLLRTHEVQSVISVFDYVWEQIQGEASPTIYYVDVLASRADSEQFIDQVVDSYR